MSDDILLRWNGTEYVGIDPETGDEIPVPFDTLEASSVNITPHATGTIELAAGADIELNRSSDYNEDYYSVFVSYESGSFNARVTTTLSVSGGEGQFKAQNDGGDNLTINWAILKISEEQ